MNALLDISTPQQGAAVKPSLAGLGRGGLRAALAAVGVPEKQLKMRVGQLWSWIYARGAGSFEELSDVSKELRGVLARAYSLTRPEIVTEQVSVDGTRKWLLRLPIRGHEKRAPEIETVYIPEADRGTLCISSQVGCTLTCSFCHTGTQRLVRNLEATEIVGQILLARDRLGDWPGAAAPQDGGLIPDSRVHASGDSRVHASGMTERKITNVVLMGMGEPLYNFDNVRDAMAIAADGDGLACRRSRAGAPRPAPCWRSPSTPRATSCATNWCRSTASIRSPS
jgi:23S rRNA (adenine2503-C2)-methyltransferase